MDYSRCVSGNQSRLADMPELLNPPKLNYEPAKDTSDVGLTEDEERELAELMSDSD